ncbi:MAG: hypothetical protein WC322_03020 [Candidatus Paceibacterota bacterium]|jgi:hypothetical protein
MAFLRYANAAVVKPLVSAAAWNDLHRTATPVLSKTAGHVVLEGYDPKQFLLTHCTIIASVDTEESQAPLGGQMVDGFQITRKYPDWLVTPETTKYINNNNDCWERNLLLSCFKTFVGGENYVEHIQIPELSKGKIIDAASRDIGDSIYVDILVATNRKHRDLISAITNGRLQTLSMGCSVEFTVCTKCGNVAADEPQLCPHVRYLKGNEWIDELGKRRRIAELCGHRTAEPGSVKFIEASWVANPAFTGAVLRSILTPEEIAGIGQRVQVAFSTPARTFDPSMLQRAASATASYLERDRALAREASLFLTPPRAPRTNLAFDDGFGQGEPQEEKPEAKADPLKRIVDDLVNTVHEKVVERVRGEMGQDDTKRLHNTDENENDTLIKSSTADYAWREIAKVVVAHTRSRVLSQRIMAGLVLYKAGGWRNVVAAQQLTGREILAVSRFVDSFSRRGFMAGEARLYRAIIAVGGIARHGDERRFLAACKQYIGRDLTDVETKALLQKGRLYDAGS